MKEQPQFIDLHSHLNFASFNDDIDDVLLRMDKLGVWAINVGTDITTSKKAVDLANKYKNLYSIVGIHPTHATESYYDTSEYGPSDDNKKLAPKAIFNSDEFYSLATPSKTIAIGECGLDYFRLSEESKSAQIDIFEKQLELANKVGKPVMLHIRDKKGSFDAYNDSLNIIKNFPKVFGDVHFFAGDVDTARKWIDRGFSLSFTGVITFSKDYDEVIKFLPIERIMAETDCPYVSPEPYRGIRNEPTFVVEVYKAISRIKETDFEECRKIIVSNSLRFMNLSV